VSGEYSNGVIDGQMLFSALQSVSVDSVLISNVFNAPLAVNLSLSNGEYRGKAALDFPPNQPFNNVLVNVKGNLDRVRLKSNANIHYGVYPQTKAPRRTKAAT
jgi:hypothetical protein